MEIFNIAPKKYQEPPAMTMSAMIPAPSSTNIGRCFVSRCVALSREHGFGRIEVANRSMVGSVACISMNHYRRATTLPREAEARALGVPCFPDQAPSLETVVSPDLVV